MKKKSAALATVKTVAIAMGLVLAGTLVFALASTHFIPDLTGPFAQERYEEIGQGARDVAGGMVEQASQIQQQQQDNSTAAPAATTTAATTAALGSGGSDGGGDGHGATVRAQAAPGTARPAAAPEAPRPATPVSSPEPSEPQRAADSPGATAPSAPAPDQCRKMPAGWPGCPEGTTMAPGEFVASQLDTRPPSDPEDIAAASAAASASGAARNEPSGRDEILARAQALRDALPADMVPAGATGGSVTRTVDGDTLVINGVRLDLSIVAVPDGSHDDASRHMRASCPVGSTAAYVPDSGRSPTSADGTQRAKVWCFGASGAPAAKSLNQDIVERGLAVADAKSCMGSSFGNEAWAGAAGC